jgi:hypothetical protein
MEAGTEMIDNRSRELDDCRGTNPSPVLLRLVKAPEQDTLSPRERAGHSHWASGFRPKMWGVPSPSGQGGSSQMFIHIGSPVPG